ncbi:MAG: ATP-binding protein [Turneriella sp.]|mgnify:CR=1 FL=1|nr:ATP-binding protein [Turneriella sp.]
MKVSVTLAQFDTNSPAGKMEILFCNWPGKQRFEKGVCFIPADLSAVAHVRGYIESVAQTFNLSEQSVFELTLVADELVANAILASYAKNGAENIVLKWTMKDNIFTLSVLDYGGGFRISDVFQEIPRGNDLASFLRSLKEYREARKAVIPLNGALIEHLRFGRGLRIISNLVRKLDIEFHEADGSTMNTPSDSTVGSIVTVEYVAEAA